jgi:AraC-like DNA-binding protein
MDEGEFQLFPARGPAALIVQGQSERAFGRHHHDEYGMGVMEAGGHRSASGRGQVEAFPGDLITVNPGEVHDGHPIGGAARRWRMLYVAPSVIADAWSDRDGVRPADFEFKAPVAHDSRSARRLSELIGRCSTSATAPDPLRIDELFVSLLARLGSGRASAASRTHTAPSAIRRALDLIGDQPDRSHSLAELARATGLDRFQVLRGIRRATGLTPHAYLVQRRLGLARSLLTGGTPIAAVAADSGFSDQSHLNRAFVRTFGYTPGAYARAFR